MSVTEHPRPPWREIESSIERFDPRALHLVVRAWIDEFMPRNIARRKGRSELRDLPIYQRRLDLVLRRELGSWYGHRAWRVGNESFGGCFCHSFLSEYIVEPRSEGVIRAAEWVVAEVSMLHRCLREFRYAYGQFGLPSDPGDRAAALAATIDQVFDAVVTATACNAAWQAYVIDGVAWMLDHRGIEAPPVLLALIDASVTAACPESVPLPRDERHRLCDDLAAVFVVASQ